MAHFRQVIFLTRDSSTKDKKQKIFKKISEKGKLVVISSTVKIQTRADCYEKSMKIGLFWTDSGLLGHFRQENQVKLVLRIRTRFSIIICPCQQLDCRSATGDFRPKFSGFSVINLMVRVSSSKADIDSNTGTPTRKLKTVAKNVIKIL